MVVPKKWDYNLLTGVPRVAEAVMFEVRARMRAGRTQVQVPGDSRWVTVPYRYDPKLRQLVYDDELRRAYGVRFDPFGSKRPGWFSVSATMGIPTAEESALMSFINSRRAAQEVPQLRICSNLVGVAQQWALKADEYGDTMFSYPRPVPAGDVANPRIRDSLTDAIRAKGRYAPSAWRYSYWTLDRRPTFAAITDLLSANTPEAAEESPGGDGRGYLDPGLGEHLGIGMVRSSDGTERWVIVAASGGTCLGPLA